jgi:hypothetical protein
VTDARLPERWIMDRRVLLASPEAWRLYTFALMYAVANRSDGRILAGDLALIPTIDPDRAAELVKLGLWECADDGWQITDFRATQSSRDQLDQLQEIRDHAAARKRAQRARAVRERAARESRDASRDSPQGQHRKDRQDRKERKRAKTEGQKLSASPSRNPLDTDASEHSTSDVQHIPAVVHHQSPATEGNARAGACEYCGKPLGRSRSDKRFCSTSCRCRADRARRQRVTADRLSAGTGLAAS